MSLNAGSPQLRWGSNIVLVLDVQFKLFLHLLFFSKIMLAIGHGFMEFILLDNCFIEYFFYLCSCFIAFYNVYSIDLEQTF